jgi:hypothetical protein
MSRVNWARGERVSIVIACDSFLALRNVRNGDLGKRLDDLHVWVDPAQMEGSRLACPPGAVIEPLLDFHQRTDPVLHSTMKTAYNARKTFLEANTQWHKRVANVYQTFPKPGLPRTLQFGREAARFGLSWFEGIRGTHLKLRQRVSELLQAQPVAEEYRRRLKAMDARLVAAFSPEGLRETILIEAANSLGIPTVVMIRSRDNLVSKIQHLPEAAAYFVWSDVVREFLRRVYPEVPDEKVRITGSPQFDHHLNPNFRLTREDYFAKMGLDAGRPLVVYTMSTPGLIPHEIDIAQHLADLAHAGKLANGAQLLVRGHPRMFGSDLRLLHREYDEARTFPRPTELPYKSAEHEAQVVQRILEDEPVHLATLAYQDVQVNVCGTMTIDSAILDKPVVNVYYDEPATVTPGETVKRFYERTDVKQMLGYKCSRLAHGPDECLRLINDYLANPALDAEGRRKAREQDCGPLDGHSGERIAALLQSLVKPAASGAPVLVGA